MWDKYLDIYLDYVMDKSGICRTQGRCLRGAPLQPRSARRCGSPRPAAAGREAADQINRS